MAIRSSWLRNGIPEVSGICLSISALILPPFFSAQVPQALCAGSPKLQDWSVKQWRFATLSKCLQQTKLILYLNSHISIQRGHAYTCLRFNASWFCITLLQYQFYKPNVQPASIVSNNTVNSIDDALLVASIDCATLFASSPLLRKIYSGTDSKKKREKKIFEELNDREKFYCRKPLCIVLDKLDHGS